MHVPSASCRVVAGSPPRATTAREAYSAVWEIIADARRERYRTLTSVFPAVR
ncbi:MAG TPA: hypothetical protein VG406_03250 [Isosphaeraceae bacterium]|nr:hypothetical protein [Isosphaeraceae bacterium]